MILKFFKKANRRVGFGTLNTRVLKSCLEGIEFDRRTINNALRGKLENVVLAR